MKLSTVSICTSFNCPFYQKTSRHSRYFSTKVRKQKTCKWIWINNCSNAKSPRSLVGRGADTPPHTPLHSAPSALRYSRLRRSSLGAIAVPQIFSSKTAPARRIVPIWRRHLSTIPDLLNIGSSEGKLGFRDSISVAKALSQVNQVTFAIDTL